MKSKTRYSFQELKKRRDGRCLFCGVSDYELLDCHRIVPGSEGGHYTEKNCVTACSLCHRRIHAGHIVIHGKWFSTAGRYMVKFTEDGEEKWK